MKIKEKISINDLYFGVVLSRMSYNSKEEGRGLEVYNLFNFGRVKHSVAVWAAMSDEKRKEKIARGTDPLRFCFGDVWSRCEYEFVVCPWGGADENDKVFDVGTKVDTYFMYVEPNRELLLDLVGRVTKSSAKAFLREYNRVYRKNK